MTPEEMTAAYATHGNCAGCGLPRIECDRDPEPCVGCDCPLYYPDGTRLPDSVVYPECRGE